MRAAATSSFCYKATEFTGQLRSSEEGEVSWVEGPIRKVGLVPRHASSAGSDGRPGLVLSSIIANGQTMIGKN